MTDFPNLFISDYNSVLNGKGWDSQLQCFVLQKTVQQVPRWISLQYYLIKRHSSYLVLTSSKTSFINTSRRDSCCKMLATDCPDFRIRLFTTPASYDHSNPMPGCTVQCLFIWIQKLRIFFSRRIRYEQVKTGALVRGDILEGRNWKHLDSGQGPELVCMREKILEDSVAEIFLTTWWIW